MQESSFDALAVQPGTMPMEAKSVAELPSSDDWQFEPKWDGFRCLAFKQGPAVELRSKSGRPLGRYFPEVVERIAALRAERLVLDGELIIPIGDALSFEALQMRLHPAESRIRKLTAETPATFMLFDCLVDEDGASLIDAPLSQRRAVLERIHAREDDAGLLLSPMTCDRQQAEKWLAGAGGALDGVVAKRRNEAYRPGERAMVKVKQLRTADCVVGGFRYGTDSPHVASLLLGLYGEDGLLHHVGFTSSIAAADRPDLTRRLEALIEAPGFTGDAPGGPSRWRNDRSAEWQPLRPELVAEVRYDHVTGQRFRHGTKFLRWRPDKAPEQCGMEQLQPEAPPVDIAVLSR